MHFFTEYEKIIIPAKTIRKTKSGIPIYYENDASAWIKVIVLYVKVSFLAPDKQGILTRHERYCYFKGRQSESNINVFGNLKTEYEIQLDLIDMFTAFKKEEKKNFVDPIFTPL